jgi:alginate O-acetyltransferase complex protein AlgI
MQFNSLTFVIFFAVVVASYYTLRSWNARKAVLVIASYLFYGAWNPLYVVLLWISTIADWLLARRIANTDTKRHKRIFLGVSLLINLGLLGYFKYGNFLLQNFVTFAASMGIEYVPPSANIVLPIGISFYTFQTLSYTLDVYRGSMPSRSKLLDFALFVSFFPQLVAGPIVRAKYFLPQCVEPKRFHMDSFGWGAALIVFGLFAKVVLADSILAPIADAVFAEPESIGVFEAWFAVFAFSGQIFFDFSGYSTVAIGSALCLGFALPDNFKAPYAAIGFSDFWRRWHISLSQWLRDYLYVPLGGNQKGALRTFASLVATMALGGLWHGASWTFVIWGLLHGLYLVIEHGLKLVLSGAGARRSHLSELALGLVTFVVVSATWVFFRSHDFQTALTMLDTMFSMKSTVSFVFAEQIPLVALVLIGMLLWHWMSRDTNLESIFDRAPRWIRVPVIAGAALGIIYSGGGAQDAFIYFQF